MSVAPRLYDLLPAIYRTRDAALEEQPLAALAAVLDDARDAMARDIDDLYRDWFVETAADDALAAIAGLVGVTVPAAAAAPRRLVADALATARGRGTRAAAERRLAALCGWPVRVATAPDAYAATVEVFRQRVLAIEQGRPAAVEAGRTSRRYHFHPAGADVPLFAPDGVDGVPIAFRPGEAIGAAVVAGGERAFAIHLRDDRDGWRIVPAEEIAVVDLTRWRPWTGLPLDARSRPRVLVDPSLGRFVLPTPVAADAVAVSCWLAAEPGLGCGPVVSSGAERPPPAWLAYVTRDALVPATPSTGPAAFPTLAQAVAAFGLARTAGEIRVADSGVVKPADLRVADTAACCPDDPQVPRQLTIAAVPGQTPCLIGDLCFSGGERGLEVTLIGLWVVGTIALSGNVVLRLVGCNVHTGLPVAAGGWRTRPAITADARTRTARLSLERTLVGPVALHGRCTLDARDSVLDGDGEAALFGNAAITLDRSTVLGRVEGGAIAATDTFFTAPVDARDGRGLLEACVVPAASAGLSLRHCVEAPAATAYRFVATRWDRPGYARLDEAGPAILRGARDGGEIGVGHGLHFAARHALLRRQAAEFMPVGLSWTIVYR